MVSRIWASAFLFAALVISSAVIGCSKEVQAPRPVPNVELDLQVSAEAVARGEIFTAEARVRNTGGGSVRYGADCCGGGALIEIRDTSDELITSNLCLALCLGSVENLTDQVLVTGIRFNGRIWRDGREMDIPPGEYTVIAKFDYSLQRGAYEQIIKSRRVVWVDNQADIELKSNLGVGARTASHPGWW
jgi:hypothetical protein